MKIIAFVIADDENLPLAKKMINSLRKFHSEEELPVHIVTGDELKQYREDDRQFFYRATPIVAEKFIDDYDMVLKLDADQIILGSLDFVLNSTGWDIGTVYNWNRVDPEKYGLVQVWDVSPTQYFNCGFVAMRSKEFVLHWLQLCKSNHFDKYQYREQDLLNILTHYGNYKVKCFDDYDMMYEYSAWHGLRVKGETMKMVLRDNKVILPKGDDNYPVRDVEIKVWHEAGGNNGTKGNYRLYFNEDMIAHIDYLVGEEKK